MKRLLIARLVLVAIGVATWGYGSSTNQPSYMYAGMGLLVVVLVLRFLPARWFDDRQP